MFEVTRNGEFYAAFETLAEAESCVRQAECELSDTSVYAIVANEENGKRR